MCQVHSSQPRLKLHCNGLSLCIVYPTGLHSGVQLSSNSKIIYTNFFNITLELLRFSLANTIQSSMAMGWVEMVAYNGSSCVSDSEQVVVSQCKSAVRVGD